MTQNSKETSQWWISLYNALFILISDKKTLESLETEHFEVMDELEAELDNGINSDGLSYFLSNNWINSAQKEALIKFKTHVDKTESNEWTLDSMFHSSDWNLIRSWALHIFNDLGLENNGWDDTGETLIIL